MRFLWLASAVSLVLVGAGSEAGQLNYRDRETRRTYSSERNETTVSLGLVPHCPQGAPTLSFGSTFHGTEPTTAPATIDVRADLGLAVSPNLVLTPALLFIAGQTPDETSIDLSSRMGPGPLVNPPGGRVDTAIAPMDLADFIRLVTARTVTANVLGLACSLNGAQLQALQSYAQMILPGRPQRR